MPKPEKLVMLFKFKKNPRLNPVTIKPFPNRFDDTLAKKRKIKQNANKKNRS